MIATDDLARARDFLAQKRIAVVGVSRNPRSFSRMVLRELARRGYDVVPVTPALAEVEGRRCVARLQDAGEPVGGALLLTPPATTEQVVRDALEARIPRIWMHRGAGPGSATPTAVALCRAGGVEPVTGLCPFMVLPGAGWIHRVHGAFRRRGARRHAAAQVG